MASGKSPLARNYDKILAVVSILLLVLAILAFVRATGGAAGEKAAFIRGLESYEPANPEFDRTLVEEQMKAYLKTSGNILKPFRAMVDESSREGFFLPATRVWCVECRKPIPFEAETCPLCGKEQPKKNPVIADDAMDSDGDGLPDVWERKFNLNPVDSSDATLDADGDGFTNAEEFANKTDPRDPESHPDILGYLRVASIEAARLPLLFQTVSSMGGGNYKCQFNYFDKDLNKGKTLFVNVGDKIGPLDRLPGALLSAPPRYSDFRLAALEWRDESVFSKIEKKEKIVKVPVAIVERISTGRRIEFLKEKESTDSSYVVTIALTRDNSEFVADGSVGEAEFKIRGDDFILAKVDVSAGTVVIRRKSDKKEFFVKHLEE